MSEKKGKKRPKSYYIKCAHGGKKAKHTNDLAADMKGFLVTCNKYEKETVREMYNILNEYADKLYGPEKPDKHEDILNEYEEDDMEKAMQKEAAKMKETKTNVRRFQNTDTKTKNLIFIRTTLDSPCELAHKIFTDIYDSQVQKARYALRMLPIAATCKANIAQISETAKSLFKRDFETSFGDGIKFTSVCKIRNNNSLSRTAIQPCLGRIIQELNPLHTLCHDEPNLVIIVEVIRNVCCLSVVKDYFRFRKYNLHEIIRTEKTNFNNSETDKLQVISKQENSTCSTLSEALDVKSKEKVDICETEKESPKVEQISDSENLEEALEDAKNISEKYTVVQKGGEIDKYEEVEAATDTQQEVNKTPDNDLNY